MKSCIVNDFFYKIKNKILIEKGATIGTSCKSVQSQRKYKMNLK